MATERTLRNVTIIATIAALIIGGSIIISDALRSIPPPLRAGGVRTARGPVDLDALEATIADARFRSLVQLAPNFATTQRGNSNPFALFER